MVGILQDIHSNKDSKFNLIADIGNSNTKFSCFDRVFFSLDELTEYIDSNFEANKPIFDLSIFSTVESKSEFVKKEIETRFNIEHSMIFDPMKQDLITGVYEGIGSDRIAKLLGAAQMHPGKNIVLMDFGTATTINVLSKNFEFLGGFIGIGFTSSLKALSDYCDALEDLSHGKFVYENSYKDMEAKDSKKAIINGTINGHIGLVNQWLFKGRQILKEKLYCSENTITICTGGDASLFIKYFDIFYYDYELLESAIKNLSLSSKSL